MRVRLLVVLLALASTAEQAQARDPIVRPKHVEFTKHRPTDAAAPAPDAAPAEVATDPDALPNPDAPAAEPVDAGLEDWVSRMEGEPAPSPESLQEIKERTQEQDEELRMIDDLARPTPPVDFYKDPKKALAADPLHLSEVDPAEFDIPIVVNDDVVRWMEYFTGSGRKYYERWMSRSTRFRPLMYREIEAQGAPRDLVYLSMIESGYSPHAYSSADAAGLWQFISATGRLYNLRIDYYVDERRDPEMATHAAVSHLSDLHKMFGDWYLAFAAYNAGPGRVRRATAAAGSKDFWTLEAGPYLQPETDNYVPKIIAAAIIGHHPERYGFDNIAFQDELVYDKADVPGNVDLGVLAKCAGLSLTEFQELNPALRRFTTPPEGYSVRVPKGDHDAFVAALEDVPKAERVAVREHTVRRGETLSIIAGNYDTTVYDIVKANNLRDRDTIEVGQTLVIPKPGEGAVTASATHRPEPAATTHPSTYVSAGHTVLASADPAPEEPKPAPKPVTTYYTVHSGDNLTAIAGKYHTSVAQLKTWNSIHGDTIVPGQKLKVGTTTAAASSSTAVAKASTSTSTTTSASTKTAYVVKKGDSLSGIASHYGVTVASVQKWNGIKDASSIYSGQKLTIYTAAPAWTSYTVRSGDSLTEIADKYNCSVADLRDWNDIDGSVIHPGQVLKVKKA